MLCVQKEYFIKGKKKKRVDKIDADNLLYMITENIDIVSCLISFTATIKKERERENESIGDDKNKDDISFWNHFHRKDSLFFFYLRVIEDLIAF